MKTVFKAVVAGVRYAHMKKAIRTGQVDMWIQDVLGNDVAYEIKHDIHVPAYISDDSTMIYFRLSDADLSEMSNTGQSFKDTVQAIAAHEKGHAIDPQLEYIQESIYHCLRVGDKDGYGRQVMIRERRAWELGRQYAPNKEFFDSYNKVNLRMYKQLLASEGVTVA